MVSGKQRFGGGWTEEKLDRIKKYLVAYATIMSKQKFRYAYIDAFAGTGYRTLKQEEGQASLMLPELAEEEPQALLDGSAKIALGIAPKFNRYIFIEKDEGRFRELEKLKQKHADLKDSIVLINGDANTCINDLCQRNWKSHRAVLFLDPFGMQVKWETIKAIAKTQAIDLWILFPLGVAVNRLLKKDGKIDPKWRARLDELFGEKDWYEAFYQTSTQDSLFGPQSVTEKVADFKAIEKYFLSRLDSVFAKVAEPLALRNRKGNPLFLLCFAASNPKGAPTAVKIAQYLLKET